MSVYILKADANRFQGLIADDPRTWADVFFHFDGQSLSDSWVKPSVRVFEGDLEKRLPAGDFPNLIGFIPVFSKRAVTALGDLLAGSGEILPLDCQDGYYYAFNVTRIVAALNESASQFKRFSDGVISGIVRYEFDAGLTKGLSIFKMPYVHKSLVYVTESFADRVRQVGLTGFLFQEI